MRDQGKTILASALASAMSERSAYNWKSGPMPSEGRRPHDWRTRKDPFADVWGSQILPLLTAENGDKLHAKTIWKLIQWPQGTTPRGSLRTLQRRMSDWHATCGPEREVYFPQEKIPGLRAGFDFTCCNELGVTVAGEPFSHLWFEYILHDSGWRDVTLARSETYEALSKGLQNALWKSGGVPRHMRHDNLSAAVREHDRNKTIFTARYKALLDAYGIDGQPITPGKSNENGTCERGHLTLKSTLEQELIVRQSRDFPTIAAYERFVMEVVSQLNDARQEAFLREKAALLPLPAQRLSDATEFMVKVLRWSTIRVHGRTYSVPSRLIGQYVRVHQYADHPEVFYKSTRVATLERARGQAVKSIDYRHVVHWLVRKPGAFAEYVHPEEMFPTVTFRRAYDALVVTQGSRADAHYLRILDCAARNGEREVEKLLVLALGAQQPIVAAQIVGHFAPKQSDIISQEARQPDLASYDELLVLAPALEVSHVQ
jgi:hypothetical protein